MERADGFDRERLSVVPRPLVEAALARPVTRRIVVTDAGYFPRAEHHGRHRPAGAKETIVIVCVAGSGWVETGGVRTRVGSATAIVIPGGVAHSYGAAGVDPWTIWWCHVRGTDVPELIEAAGVRPDRLTLSLREVDRVTSLLDEISVALARDTTPARLTTTAGMDEMLRATGTTGAVLVTTGDPHAVAAQLRDEGYTVRTPAELREASLRLATDIYGSPVRLMVGVAFAAGTLIVALVAYTRVTEQQRDLGVLKALGATPGRLRRIAVTETVALTVLGTLAAIVLLIITREVLAWWRPAFPVLLTSGTIAQTAAAAVTMALLAAWLPARRLNRLDAASAFRSGR